MSETERDSGWSEQYADTGGWPPPAEGQRRYGPGAPAGDASAPADESTQRTSPAAGQESRTGGDQGDQTTGGYAEPGQWDLTGGGQAAGHAQPGQWDPTGGGQSDQVTGGYAQPGRWGRTSGDHAEEGGQAGYNPPGPWGQPSSDPATGPWDPHDQAGGRYGRPGHAEQAGPGYAQPAGGEAGPWGYPAGQAGQRGRPADQAEPGTYGEPSQTWAPGDSAYGRLGRQTPPPPPAQQRPRRPWEGRPAPARRPGGTPVVTITLIAVCVVIYLVQRVNPEFTARYALIPYDVQHGQYARLITSAFLHASLLHLGTNMITLYIVGAPLERVLRPARYLIVYFLSALGGSLFSVWLSPEFSVGVGASGAIFGLFGALVVLRRQVGAEAGGLAVLIGLNLVISFTVPNISWQAHIGGLVTGVLVALALRGIDGMSRRRPAG